MSLSDSSRVSPQPSHLSPTDTTGRTEDRDPSRDDGAFTGKGEKGTRRPVISQRELDSVRRKLNYHMSESEERGIPKTESCSTDSADELAALWSGAGLQLPQTMARVSSTDPQLISFASPPVTTAGTTANIAADVTACIAADVAANSSADTTAVAEAANGIATPITTAVNREAITPQTQALFTGIRSGKRSLFDHIPQQRTAQRTWGIDIDCQDPQSGRTPLTMALVLRAWDIAVELLSLGADPDLLDGAHDAPRELASPLCKMILQFFSWSAMKQSGDWSPANEVLLKDLLLTRDSVDGYTMLTWAAGRRHDKLACMLIDAGAGFEFSSKQGESPFEAACRKGSLSLVLTMLDAWSELITTDLGRAYFRLALRGAIEARRPAVVAEMLSAFRRIYRAGGKAPAQEDALDVKEIIPRDRRSEADAYHAFFGGQPSTTFVFDTALQRTRDDCLLTREECSLLMLNDMQVLAARKAYSDVLVVIEAHYKLASGIPRTITVAGRVNAGNVSRELSGVESTSESSHSWAREWAQEPTSESTYESPPESTSEPTSESSLSQ